VEVMTPIVLNGRLVRLELKTIRLDPGQPLTVAGLTKAEQNLKRLNLFESATVTVVDTHSDITDILVIVKEKK
jgi:outer membrane protein assembly factor BamA